MIGAKARTRRKLALVPAHARKGRRNERLPNAQRRHLPAVEAWVQARCHPNQRHIDSIVCRRWLRLKRPADLEMYP